MCYTDDDDPKLGNCWFVAKELIILLRIYNYLTMSGT